MKYISLGFDLDILQIFQRARLDVEFIVDTALFGDRLSQISNQCEELGLDLTVVSSFTEIGDIYSLVSYFWGRKSELGGVLSYYETTQFAASILNKELGLREEWGPALHILRDKRMMKHALSELIPMAPYISVPDYLALSGENVGRAWDFPLVVKPVNGVATRGVELLLEREDLNSWLHRNEAGRPNFIIESVLTGVEHCADIVWSEGEPLYVFVGRYAKPRLKSLRDNSSKVTMYLDSDRYVEIYERAITIGRAAIRGAGLKNGVTHMEFFLDGEVITVNEIAGRAPGGGGASAIKSAIGESTKQLGLRAAIGNFDGAPATRTLKGYFTGFVDLRPTKTGVISGIADEQELLLVPNVVSVEYNFKVGDRFEHDTFNNWGVVAVIRTATEAEFLTTVEQLNTAFWCNVQSLEQ